MNKAGTQIKLSDAVSLFSDKLLINNGPKSVDLYLLVLTRFRICVGDDFVSNIVKNKDNFDSFFEKIKEQHQLNETTLFIAAMHLRVFLKYLKENRYIDTSVDIDNIVNYNKYKSEYKKRFYSLSPESLYPFEEDQIRMYWLLQEPTLVSLRNAFKINLMLDTGIKSIILRSLLKENFNYSEQTLSVIGKHRSIQMPVGEETSILGRN